MARVFVATLVSAALLTACSRPETVDTQPAPESPAGQPATLTPEVPVLPTSADQARLNTLISHMTGAFDSAEQAAADDAYSDIRMHMAPIWTDRTDGKWLYVEQAMATQVEGPYRQRVYRVTARGNGRFVSEVFELPGHPLRFVGAWRDPTLLEGVSPDQLIARDGCAIVLTDRKDAFIGSTNHQDCPSSLQGAAYATSEVVITSDTLVSWDRGFDAEGRQVWGVTKSGYIFKKRPR